MILPEEARLLPYRPQTQRSWTGKHEHAQLSGELAGADEEAFRTMVRALLRLLCVEPGAPIPPSLFLSPNGDDLLLEEDPPYPLYAQLLIFREPPASLGEPQLQRARAAIGRFLESGLEVGTYLLVLNSDLRSPELRAGIQTEILRIVESGRAERAEVWDRQRLLREAFNAMADHVLAAAEAGGLARVRLEELLRTREGVPLEEVPMRTSLLAINQYQLRSVGDPGPQIAGDPAIAILQGEDTNLTLLLGSFGFGKTTAVARSLSQRSRHVLYVPGASISETVVGTKDLLSRCVSTDDLFRSCPREDRDIYELIARAAVEHLFRKDEKTPLAIVIDGLDESPFLGRQGGLQQLFNCLRIVSIPVVLAMRTEFWDDRRQEFETTVGLISRQGPVRPRTVRAIELLPWQDEQVLLFVRRARQATEDPEQQGRIARLEALVEGGGYEAIYGDIQRRPLFLRVIVESVAETGLPGERIGRARLFRDWAQWKIRRDVVAVRAQGGARPHLVKEKESAEDVVKVAWEAMLQAAASMTREHEGRLELTPDCLLDEVLASTPRLRQIEDELALHHQSLLMPVGERRGDRPSRISFAHRAFQEFFLAWLLLQEGKLGESPALPDAVADWVRDLQNEGLVDTRQAQEGPPRPAASPPRHAGPALSGHVDLELLVQERPGSGRRTFDFFLTAHDPELGLNRKPFGSVTLEREPAELFKQHLADLERLAVPPEGMEEKGAFLSERILPPDLRRRLTELQDKAVTLLIQSDEPWIPWELLRLGSGEEADGPFLCDAFAMTRWLQGTRLTTWLPLRRMAVIAPRDSGLDRAEQEWERLHGMRQPDHEVERLPARLASLREAFRKGEHDGWHFIGHGLYRDNAPDLSGIVLEEGEVLTPEQLAGPSKRMGTRRPLVFLNACSSGRSGISLTGLGGWAPDFIKAGAGAFLSALWPIGDRHGSDFALAFYEAFRGGMPLAEAVRTARRAIRSGDPTWLGYAVYGHPLAFCEPSARRHLTIPATTMPEPPSNAPPQPSIFVGRGRDLARIKARLGAAGGVEGAPGLQVITAVRGWPGVGKSTLAAALAHDPEIRAAFPDGILWASLGHSPDLLSELAGWGRVLGSEPLQTAANLRDATDHLKALLRARRALLVFDDVWDPAHAAPVQNARGAACALLVTTRQTGVAESLSITPDAAYHLEVLDEESSLDLLSRLAPGMVERHPAECRTLVRELEFLPLALQVAGRLLHAESRMGWGVSNLIRDLAGGTGLLGRAAPPDRAKLDGSVTPTIGALLRRSTDLLDPETRERFRLLGDFVAKPATFSLDALGLTWEVEDPRPTVRILVDRGLLEPAGDGRFQMHSLLVQHAASLEE